MAVVQMNIRVPKEVKDFLLEQAKHEGRSLNNYLVKSFEDLKSQLKQKSAKA